MDAAVALVQSYLRVNGYFTVTELPGRRGDSRCRVPIGDRHRPVGVPIPSAAHVVLHRRPGASHLPLAAPDPVLEVTDGVVDMLVGEVKESSAEFNPGGLRPDVLAAALARFGCCRPGAHAKEVVSELLDRGRADAGEAHIVRLVAFGSKGARGEQ